MCVIQNPNRKGRAYVPQDGIAGRWKDVLEFYVLSIPRVGYALAA